MNPTCKKYRNAGFATVCSLIVIAALAFGIRKEKSDMSSPNMSADCLANNTVSAANITDAVPDGNQLTQANGNQSASAETAATASKSKHTATVVQYPSTQPEGIIGSYAGKLTDNPADNIFTVGIDRELSPSDKVYLCYELEGIADFAGIARSINDRLAKGGYLVKTSDTFSPQREQINPAWLKQGENRITFSLPDNADFGYRVKNLSIEVEKSAGSVNTTNNTPLLAVNTSQNSYGNQTCIYGFVQGTDETATIHIAGRELQTLNGEFEAIIDVPSSRKTEITATLANGSKLSKEIFYTEDAQADIVYAFNNDIQQTAKTFTKGIADKIELETAILNVDSAGLLARFLRNVFDFVMTYVKYETDNVFTEQLRTLKDQKGDCDCMSILIGSILYNKNIPFYFRVSKYDVTRDFSHVYVIVPNVSCTVFDTKGHFILPSPSKKEAVQKVLSSPFFY